MCILYWIVSARNGAPSVTLFDKERHVSTYMCYHQVVTFMLHHHITSYGLISPPYTVTKHSVN
jgi:hypothetical protein